MIILPNSNVLMKISSNTTNSQSPFPPFLPNHAQVNTQNYRCPEAPEARAEPYMGQSQPHASSKAFTSNQQLDSAALGRVVAALLGQDQDGGGFLSANNDGGRAASDGNTVAGAGATSREWYDIVVVDGCNAFDAEILTMGAIGLSPARAIKVFVDVVPQVCESTLASHERQERIPQRRCEKRPFPHMCVRCAPVVVRASYNRTAVWLLRAVLIPGQEHTKLVKLCA